MADTHSPANVQRHCGKGYAQPRRIEPWLQFLCIVADDQYRNGPRCNCMTSLQCVRASAQPLAQLQQARLYLVKIWKQDKASTRWLGA